MRLLYARSALLRGRAHGGRPGENLRPDSRTDERQHLSLRRLQQHRRGDPAGDGAAVMIGFEYVRATDVADAVRQMAGNPRAKFVAGGTNLIDLMKMDVEQPTRVIDITRLPRRHGVSRAQWGMGG